jgi:hypothetical protein
MLAALCCCADGKEKEGPRVKRVYFVKNGRVSNVHSMNIKMSFVFVGSGVVTIMEPPSRWYTGRRLGLDKHAGCGYAWQVYYRTLTVEASGWMW